MIKNICIFLLVPFVVFGNTNDISEHILAGIPKSEKNLIFLENIGYVAGYNEENGCAAWVSYKLEGGPKKNAVERPSRFIVDGRTKDKVSHDDYTNTGYDRGHMAPNSAIGRYYGAEAQRETFLMSNVVPQKPDLNRRSWKELEASEIKMAGTGVVWVVTGPVFDDFKEVLPLGVEIPDWCYKIIVSSNKVLSAFSVMIPRDVSGTNSYKDFVISVDEIEKVTGLDFFSELDDNIEDKMESVR